VSIAEDRNLMTSHYAIIILHYQSNFCNLFYKFR